jgi:hypothetical protein
MAIATGSQIRPELSAVDYTPFLQASGQAAQMQAQGITSAVGGALKGFESIVQQQKENKKIGADIKAAVKFGNSVQPFLKDVDEKVQAQFSGIMADLTNPALSDLEKSTIAKGIPQALNNLIGMSELGRKTQDEKATAQYAGMLKSGGGNIPTPMSDSYMSRFTPEQKLSGEALYLRAEKQKADIANIKAEAQQRLAPKAPSKPTDFFQKFNQKVAAFKELNDGLEPSETDKSKMMEDISAQSRATSTVNIGAGLADTITKDLLVKKNSISSFNQLISNYDVAINEIAKSGAFSGPAGAIKYAGAKALELFGNTSFKSESDGYQAAGSALASGVLSMAKQLPGALSDKDVRFLEDVVSGKERVPNVEVLRKIKSRAEASLKTARESYDEDVKYLGLAGKGDTSMEFGFKYLNRPVTLKPFPK